MRRSGSEPLGPQQGDHKVGREARYRQAEQDKVEGHGSAPLAADQIPGEEGEADQGQRQHEQVEHLAFRRTRRPGAGRSTPLLCSIAHKRAMRTAAAGDE
jgi:hypothetical protein